MSGAATALWFLALGVVAQFAWRIAPVGIQGDAWTVSQAVLLLVSLGLNAYAYRPLREAIGLLSCWQLMTIIAGVAYMAHPWKQQEGEARLSDLLNLPLGAIGGFVAVVLAWRLYTDRGRRGRTD